MIENIFQIQSLIQRKRKSVVEQTDQGLNNDPGQETNSLPLNILNWKGLLNKK